MGFEENRTVLRSFYILFITFRIVFFLYRTKFRILEINFNSQNIYIYLCVYCINVSMHREQFP